MIYKTVRRLVRTAGLEPTILRTLDWLARELDTHPVRIRVLAYGGTALLVVTLILASLAHD